MSGVGSGADAYIGDEPHWNVATYTVVEDSTPIDPSDMTGGYGQVTVAIKDAPVVKHYGGKELRLLDGAQGQTIGTVRGRSGNGLSASVVADSRLAQIAVIRRAAPFQGTLDEALLYYFELCGITTGIVIDESFTTVDVALQGWNANVYDQLKKMSAAFGFEVSLVSNNIVVRPLRQNIAVTYRDASVSWALDEQNLAQTVEGVWYNPEWKTDIAYPPGGWNDDVTVYSVDAGETLELDLEIDASLVSVEQPTCVSSVDRNHASSSVYSVSGNDGLIVPPTQWAADGGLLTVEIGEDTRSLKVTIKGGNSEQYAPYSIAMASGTSDNYSSLRIRGTGTFVREDKLVLPAHMNADRAPDEVGFSVENEFFATKDQLFHALLRTAVRYAVPRQTITVKSKGINRLGSSGSAVYPTIGDVKALYPDATIGELKLILGPTIADWNAILFALVQDDFQNQAFGNVNGARVLHDDSWYRIRSATTTPTSVDYQAERDNTIGDVYAAGPTIGDWNARWAGKTIGEVNIAPLWHPPVSGDGFGGMGFGEGGYGE